jgi:hypothetical protein
MFRKLPKEFEAWLRMEPKEQSKNLGTVSSLVSARKATGRYSTEYTEGHFLEVVKAELSRHKKVSFTMDWRFQTTCQISNLDEGYSFGEIHLYHKGVNFNGTRIDKLFLDKCVEPIRISDCKIGEIALWEGSRANLILEDCSVGTLILNGDDCCRTLIIERCTLEAFIFKGDQAIKGPVVFTDIYMPKAQIYCSEERLHSLRRLRGNLLDLGNSQAASAVHGVELAYERQHESWFNRILSWAYELLGNFGDSIGRPLLLLVVLIIASASVLLVSNGAVVDPMHEDQFFGTWREVLNYPNVGALVKSLVLSVQSILTPLALLGAHSVVVARYWWLQAYLVLFHGPLSLTLLTLFFIGLRRRFRLQ